MALLEPLGGMLMGPQKELLAQFFGSLPISSKKVEDIEPTMIRPPRRWTYERTIDCLL